MWLTEVMRHNLLTALAVPVLLVGLVGCSGTYRAPEEAPPEVNTKIDSLSENEFPLQDGDTVRCIVYAFGHKGGVSCDWEGIER